MPDPIGRGISQAVRVEVSGGWIDGDLTPVDRPRGLVLFAHGSGSGRQSPRNKMVASLLNAAGFSTLLVDLLTPAEDRQDQMTGELRFDIDRLAGRVVAVTDWVRRRPSESPLPLGYFGASTGAAAALAAAAARPDDVSAVVSRGGRPDLAMDVLDAVRCPVLLVVGGEDHPVIELNQGAFERLTAERRLEIVPGASHLFEQPGALEVVAHLAGEWFDRHLAGVSGAARQ